MREGAFRGHDMSVISRTPVAARNPPGERTSPVKCLLRRASSTLSQRGQAGFCNVRADRTRVLEAMKDLKPAAQKLWHMTLVLWIALARSEIAWSDEAMQRSGSDDAGVLQEVVVTAEKRSEDVLKVPLSVSAISGDQLLSQQITTLDDLARAVPGLSITSYGGAGLSNIEIRGISSDAGNSTVSVYLDDVPITNRNNNNYSAGAAEPLLFDIKSIEVLRGPQGTLYGASSMGGTIKYITNQPDTTRYDVSARAETSYTKHGSLNSLAEGVVNIPVVSDVAAIRGGIQVSRDSGFINRVSPVTGEVVDRNINSATSLVARVASTINASQNLTITPEIIYQDLKLADTAVYDPTLPSPFETQKLVPEAIRDQLRIATVKLTYKMPAADITSISSYFQRDQDRVEDGTYYNAQLLGSILQSQLGFGGSAFNYLYAPLYFDTHDRGITEELRITSSESADSASRLSWIGGLYYSDEWRHYLDNEFVDGFNATVESTYHMTPAQILGSPFPNDNVYFSGRQWIQREYAIFGEINYLITPKARLTIGARAFRANSTFSGDTAAGFFVGAAVKEAERSSDRAFTPRFAFTYEITDRNALYASASKGYRLGGTNREVPYIVCQSDFVRLGIPGAPSSYKADSLWNYEVGSKNRLLDNRLSVNASLYLIKWTQIQQNILLTCGDDFVANVGQATSYGTEIEASARPTQHWSISLGGGYTSATLKDSEKDLGIQSGADVLGVPKYSASAVTDYTIPLSGGASGVIRFDYRLTGPSHGSFSSTAVDFYRPSYDVVNASIAYRHGGLEASLFAKNLLDQHRQLEHPAPLFLPFAVTVRPRTVGLSAQWRW
jgi:iron complex outermembrane receptor protein